MLLHAEHLNFGYFPDKTVLHDVSLDLGVGEILYILGKNGSGKTTLLNCLSGLLRPNAGTILLNGNKLMGFSIIERAQKMALIPQMHRTGFAFTVRQMVMMGRAPHLAWMSSPSKEDDLIVEESLEQVGLYELRNRPYTEISGGEQQLVLIARGLAQKCPILLMDEPTAHLDLSNQHKVLEIVHQLAQQDLSFIISSHAPNDALTYADNVLLLSGGWVIDYGNPERTLTEKMLSSVYGIQTEVIYQQENGSNKARAVLPRRPMIVKPDSLRERNSFLSHLFKNRKDKRQLLLITGLSGVGKTTWCRSLVDAAMDRGFTVEGVLSPGLFEGKKKIGIEVTDLSTGEKRQLAKLRERDTGGITTPRWVFDPDALEWANQALEKRPERDLLIIDELGPLEFLRNKGLVAGLERLDQRDYQVACVVVRSSLLQNALQRWPEAYVVNGSL